MVTVNEALRDFVIDGVASSGAHKPKKADLRAVLSAISTGSSDGIYDFIPASNLGAGTPNAIQATTDVAIPATPNGALIALPIVALNTATPVTVSFNGASPLTIKTAAGNDLAVGGLTVGVVSGYASGGTFRLLSDQASAAIVAAAEQAVLDAEAARDAAQAAVSSVVPNIFATKAAAQAYAPAVAPDFINTAGYSAAGDGGGANYKKVASEPAHAGKFSITLAGGSVVWYEIAEQVLTERMFGAPCNGMFDSDIAIGTDATAILQAWADCPVSNHKRFTGISRVTGQVTFPVGTILEGMGHQTGITGKQIVSYSGLALILVDGSAGLTKLPMTLGANAAKGDTRLTLAATGLLSAGDYFCIYNPTDFSWANFAGRNSYRAGEWCRALSVGVGTVNLMEPLWDAYTAANVEVYILRSPQTVFRDFRIETPQTDYKAGFKISTIINPIVDNVLVNGLTEYAGGVLERCVDIRVHSTAFQGIDPTPDNEYGIIVSSCTGGSIRGDYYAQRHAIAFGNSDFLCCVPNRNVIVEANTYNTHPTGSIDFGHGCSENLTLLGGTHTGVTVGGKNHRFIGCKFRKGRDWIDTLIGGLVASGSEFVGGEFVFEACEFTCFFNPIPGSGGPAPVNFVMLGGVKESCRFIFNDCAFLIPTGTTYAVRVQNNGSLFKHSFIMSNPRVVGGGDMTQFVRLQNVSGETEWELVDVRGVNGVGGTIPRVVIAGTVTAITWKLDPQLGRQTANGNTGATQVAQAVTFNWPYPSGAVPECQAWQFNATIGGKRCIVIAGSASSTGFTATVMTADAANFATSAAGTVAWQASIG